MTEIKNTREDFYQPTIEEIVPGVTLFAKIHGSTDYAEVKLHTEEDVEWAMESMMNVREEYATRIYTVPNTIKMRK